MEKLLLNIKVFMFIMVRRETEGYPNFNELKRVIAEFGFLGQSKLN
jgi:hypothetical protein